jgi:hypothetical protein
LRKERYDVAGDKNFRQPSPRNDGKLLPVHEENDAAEFHVNTRSKERGRDKYEQVLYDEWPD